MRGCGARSELLTCAWLMSLEFQVFRNQSARGPVDLVALDRATGEIILIDVKTNSTTNPTTYFALTEEQARLGVRILVVDAQTGAVSWQAWQGRTRPPKVLAPQDGAKVPVPRPGP